MTAEYVRQQAFVLLKFILTLPVDEEGYVKNPITFFIQSDFVKNLGPEYKFGQGDLKGRYQLLNRLNWLINRGVIERRGYHSEFYKVNREAAEKLISRNGLVYSIPEQRALILSAIIERADEEGKVTRVLAALQEIEMPEKLGMTSQEISSRIHELAYKFKYLSKPFANSLDVKLTKKAKSFQGDPIGWKKKKKHETKRLTKNDSGKKTEPAAEQPVEAVSGINVFESFQISNQKIKDHYSYSNELFGVGVKLLGLASLINQEDLPILRSSIDLVGASVIMLEQAKLNNDEILMNDAIILRGIAKYLE